MWKAFVIIAFLDGSPLAAVADEVAPKAQPPHHHKIPDEAFAACKDHSEGAACTVTMRDKTRDGVCRASHHQDQRLFCMPPHPHQPPPP